MALDTIATNCIINKKETLHIECMKLHQLTAPLNDLEECTSDYCGKSNNRLTVTCARGNMPGLLFVSYNHSLLIRHLIIAQERMTREIVLMKPFSPPLLKRSNVNENEAPQPKKIKLGSADSDSGPRLIFKKSGVSSVPRKPFSKVENPAEKTEEGGPKGYYNVLWRKITNKKNKTWEGDALLYVASDGSAELQDSDTGRSFGRAKCQEPLLPGSTMLIAGKDIEIENVLSRDQYLARKKQPSAATKEKYSDPAKKHGVAETGHVHLNIKQEVKRWIGSQSKPRQPSDTASSAAAIKDGSLKTLTPSLKPSKAQRITEVPIPSQQHDPEALVMKRTLDAKVDVIVDPLLSKKLRQHQRDGIKFLYECVMGLRDFDGHGAILADEMGLGKTLQTIALLWTLLKQSPSGHGSSIKKVLIVCPATLVNNWRKEFRKWLGLDRIGVLIADGKARINHFTHGKSYSVMIVGYEKLRTIQADLAKGQGVDLIVAGE